MGAQKSASTDAAPGELSAPDDGWQARVDAAKRRERGDLSLEAWRKYGFAGARAPEFERLASAGDEPEGAVPRMKFQDLTQEEFWDKFEKACQPCIISGIPEAEGWSAVEAWPGDSLCRRFGDVSFRVGKSDDGKPIRLRMDDFAAYLRTQADDSPLYLFDNRFGTKKEVKEQLLQEYSVPQLFPDDYMALAGEDGRPPYRWISIGPRRSGTVMHIDPLGTSAWNTLISGRKRWVLLHPTIPRSVAKAKHVMEKGDDDEAVNVFLDLLPRLRAQGVKTVEFVQYPGETVFLPGNWWHCVVNVEDAVAVTQNYAGRHNFPVVWRAARTERPCWSHRWLKAMDEQLPELAARARAFNEADGFDMEALLQKNRERRQRRRQRREARALRAARRRARGVFDEEQWRRKRAEERSSSSDSDSTVSTSSASDSSSAASSSAASSSAASSAAAVA